MIVRADEAKGISRAIVEYYLTHRQIGHTSALVDGLETATEARVAVVTSREATYFRDLGIGRDRVLPFGSLVTALRGARFPLVIDHHATMHLLHALLGWISDLEEENKNLEEVVWQARKAALSAIERAVLALTALSAAAEDAAAVARLVTTIGMLAAFVEEVRS